MERTSSLDMFRGSEAFSDLNFLDGQESLFETSTGQPPATDLQPSQPFPANLPVTSTHSTSGQRPSSKLFNSSRLATAPTFSSWPQASSHAFTTASQPASMRHDFLPYNSSTSQRPPRAADSQSDSFAALLADDTALGFADDCFRRESDLFLSQERVATADALSLDPPPSTQGQEAPPQQLNVAVSTQLAAAHTAPEQAAAAMPASTVATAQQLYVPSPQAMPAAETGEPSPSDPPASGVSCHGQAADTALGRPDTAQAIAALTSVSTPARDEQSLESESQEHTSQNSEGRSFDATAAGSHNGHSVQAAADAPVVATAPAPPSEPVVPQAASPSSSPRSIQLPSSPSDHLTNPAQHADASSPQGLNQTRVAETDAQQAGMQEHTQHISPTRALARPSIAIPAESAPVPIQPTTVSLDSSLRQPGQSDSVAGRPQLSVQEYQLPSPQVKVDKKAEPYEGAPVPADVSSQSRHMEGLEPVLEPPIHANETAGAPDFPAKRHWSHQLTQVFKAAFPGRSPQLPISDSKLPSQCHQSLLAAMPAMAATADKAASPAADPAHGQASALAAASLAASIAPEHTVPDQLNHPPAQPPASPQTSAPELQQAKAQSPVRHVPLPHAPQRLAPQTNGHPQATTIAFGQQQTPGKRKGLSGTASQLPDSSAGVAPDAGIAASRQASGSEPDKEREVCMTSPSIPAKSEITSQAQANQPAPSRLAPPSTAPSVDKQPSPAAQKPTTSCQQADSVSVSASAVQAPIKSPAEAAVQAVQAEATCPSTRHSQDTSQSSLLEPQQPVAHDQAMLEASVTQTGLDLASKVEAANSAVPTVLAECLASNRIKRVPGGDPLEAAPFRRFVEMVRSNSHDFEAQGRVLRLKQYISADVRPAAINAILEALAVNTLVEVLYIQNFEQGMFDEQLVRLTEVLKKGRIWALNAGENFEISLQAWERFTKELQHTAVAYMYVSEHHLARTDLKRRMQDAIRDNRRQAPRREADVIKCVGNMWWNPKMPADMRSGTSRAAGEESALASLARDMAASQAGSRHSVSGSQSRKRKLQPQDTAVSSQGDLHVRSNSKPTQKDAKRARPATTAGTDSPETTDAGSAADSQPQLTTSEKRELRIKRREQRLTAEAGPVALRTRHGQDTVTAVASSPAPGNSRTPATAPAGLLGARALGSRSRLADQSGPLVSEIDDSDDPDRAAVMEAAGAAATVGYDSPLAAEKSGPVGHKRKRRQQQTKPSAVGMAMSVRLANSLAVSDQPEPDAMTEQSRSSEAATPVGPRRRRGQAQSQSVPSAAQPAQQQEEELDFEQTQPVRRTGRQRKLTAAAAAAVEDFPSLYKQPAKPPASASKAKEARDTSDSNAVHADWPEDHASAGKAPKRGQSKQAKGEGTPSNGVNLVQMSQLVRYGVLPAGQHEFIFKNLRACEVEVLPDGDILYQGELYDSLAKFGRAVLAETSSGRQSCNCWRDVSWQGQKMEALREEAHAKFVQAKRIQKK